MRLDFLKAYDATELGGIGVLVTVTEKRRRYQSYLLRLWPASEEDETIWRASLEDPLTGQRQGFANLDELFGFLQQQTRGSDTERRMNEQNQN